MARSWPNDGTRNYLICAPGTLTAAGQGPFTLIALINPTSATRGAALSLRAGGSIVRQIIIDSNKWFGANDFTGIAGPLAPVAGQYQFIAQTKSVAGPSVLRWHWALYDPDGEPDVFHADGTWTVGDGAAIDEIRIGDGNNEGRGLGAVMSAWDHGLGDDDITACFTAAAADIANQSPDGLWLLNQLAIDERLLDATGHGADQLAEDGMFGAVGLGADPAGYDYGLTPPDPAAPAPEWRSGPPRLAWRGGNARMAWRGGNPRTAWRGGNVRAGG